MHYVYASFAVKGANTEEEAEEALRCALQKVGIVANDITSYMVESAEAVEDIDE